MADKIIRVLAKDAPVKASAITAKEMVERARQIHKTLPVATAALGRSLMAASMMGNQLKEKDGSVTLRIKGGGPLGGITVVSDSQGNARGYVVNPLVDLPLKGPAKLDVGSAVGRDGSLTVIKDRCMKGSTSSCCSTTAPPRVTSSRWTARHSLSPSRLEKVRVSLGEVP